MTHVTALAGAIIWLGLNGLLWYTRPSDLLSLLGSSILGAVFSAHSLFICNGLITALTRSRTLDNDQPMSAVGQSRRIRDVRVTSSHPPKAAV